MRWPLLVACFLLTACATSGIESTLRVGPSDLADSDWPGPRAFTEEVAFATIVGEALDAADVGFESSAIRVTSLSPEEAKERGNQAATLGANALDAFEALMVRYDEEARAINAGFRSSSITREEAVAQIEEIATNRERAIELARDLIAFLEDTRRAILIANKDEIEKEELTQIAGNIEIYDSALSRKIVKESIRAFTLSIS